jgi:type II secretion system protein N
MEIRLPILGSFLLGLFLFYLFFLWQFPYDRLKSSIKENVEENLPLTLAIGRVGPYFPLGLRLENIQVSSDSLSFHVPDLTFGLSLPSLLLGKTDLAVSDSRNSSRLQGRFSRGKDWNRLNLRLNHLEVKTSSPKEFSFLLKFSGEASFQWKEGDLEKGSGQAWALLERGEILSSSTNEPINPESNSPPLSRSSLERSQISQAPSPLALFESLRAEVQVKDGIIRLKRLEALGKETRFSLPKDLQFSLKGGIPRDWGMILNMPIK